MTKNGQKWSKTGFWTYQEYLVISFIWKWYKMKTLMVLYHSVKTACLGKSGSQVMGKMLLAIEALQYS